MKKAIAVMMLLTGGLFAAPRINVGIGIGAVQPIRVVRPACPGPGYSWVDGYYATNGVFVNGYWAPPARVVAPIVTVGPHFDHDRDFHARFDRDHDARFDHFRR